MTLDEAIEHAERCADNSCGDCVEEHEQLAEWLRELRQARMKIYLLKILRDGFNIDAQMYKYENARLRELVSDMYGFIRDVCELHPYVLTNAHIPEWQITDHSTPAERYAEKLRELGIEVDDGQGE